MKRIYTLMFLLVLFFSGNNAYSQTLVINEFDYDQIGPDSAEFLELYNGSANAIDFGLYSLVLVNGNGGLPYNTITLPSQFLNPGFYFVICGSFNIVPFCNMVYDSLSSNILQNGSPDAIALVLTSTGSIVDVVSYEGTVPGYFEGTGIPASPTTSDSGAVSFVGISRIPNGQDLGDNSLDFQLVCITPGTANVSANTNCQQPVSVPVVQSKNSLKLYPNPTRGLAFVDLNGLQLNDASLIINNVLGKEIKKISLKSFENFHQIDLSDLQDGIYYVKLKSSTVDKTQRIILRK